MYTSHQCVRLAPAGAAGNLSSRRIKGNSTRIVTRMGNKAVNGPFAPIVRVARELVGVKQFNLLRGKAIALHSNIIKDFCTNVGTNRKVAQGVIRLAKKNGENLGFLA